MNPTIDNSTPLSPTLQQLAFEVFGCRGCPSQLASAAGISFLILTLETFWAYAGIILRINIRYSMGKNGKLVG